MNKQNNNEKTLNKYIRNCCEKNFYNPILYYIEGIEDSSIVKNELVNITDANLFFALRIYNTINTNNKYNEIRSLLIEKVIKAQEKENCVGTNDLCAIIFGIIVLNMDGNLPIIEKGLFDHPEKAYIINNVAETLNKYQTLQLFSILAHYNMYDCINPSLVYGKISDDEKVCFDTMISELNNNDTIDAKMLAYQLCFNCQVEVPLSLSQNRKSVWENIEHNSNDYSMDFLIYVNYSLLPNMTFTEKILKKIFHNNTIKSHYEFEEFFLRVVKNEECLPFIYRLLLYSFQEYEKYWIRAKNEIMTENENPSLISKLRHISEDISFIDKCRNHNYYNSIRFFIHNIEDKNKQEHYFDLLLSCDLYLAALTISSMYSDTFNLEEKYDNAIDLEIQRVSDKLRKNEKVHIIRIFNLIFGLLVLNKYEKFERVVVEIFCPFIEQNKPITGFPNKISSRDRIKLLAKLCEKNLLSIIPSHIIVRTLNNQEICDDTIIILKHLFKGSSCELNILFTVVYNNSIYNIEKLINCSKEYFKKLVETYFKFTFSEDSFAKYIFLYYRRNISQLSKEQKLAVINRFVDVELFKMRYLIKFLQDVKDSQFSFEEKEEIINSMACHRLITNPILYELFLAIDNESVHLKPFPELAKFKKFINKQYIQNTDDNLLDKAFLEKFFLGKNSPSYMVEIYMQSDLKKNLSIEIFLDFIYPKINFDNSILRSLFWRYPIKARVKKTTPSTIYIVSRDILLQNEDAKICISDTYNQIISDNFFDLPQKNDTIFVTIHSYNKYDKCVKFCRPGYTPEDTINYHKNYNDLLEKMKGNDINND